MDGASGGLADGVVAALRRGGGFAVGAVGPRVVYADRRCLRGGVVTMLADGPRCGDLAGGGWARAAISDGRQGDDLMGGRWVRGAAMLARVVGVTVELG